ncbi:hypothetical protein C7M30_02821 [Bacillus subtilis]|nr:hypothetical protein C7M30_02821 [Bacillus subtilis]
MGKTGYIGAAIVVAACIIILSAVVCLRDTAITSLCAGLASYCFSREL